MPPTSFAKARNHKGQSLLLCLQDYVVIDIETTGLAPGSSAIIELAALRVKNGRIAGQFQTLVDPEQGISRFITNLTGITNAMTRNAPKIHSALADYLDFVSGDVVIGHNVHFDVNFIYDNAVAHLNTPFCNNFIDTMRISRRLYKHCRGHRLSDLVRRFEIGTAVLHRALADVGQTQKCYEYMKSDLDCPECAADLLIPVQLPLNLPAPDFSAK